MEPWYKVVLPRAEVREGRSFNPDEFAIALEQVVAGTAPEDYTNPANFFARTCFTKALREHMGMVARRLVGETVNAAPVLTLITQFGGGKTHTLTALYHLVKNREYAESIGDDLRHTLGVEKLPEHSKVAVFVGNAWDPGETRETPWIDIARQLAGEAGVTALGSAARTTPPGTEAIGHVIDKAGGSVLILFDEVLNFLNRHRNLAEGFYAFIQNLTVAMTGARGSACVISLPRSQVEMSESDLVWQERITKVVKRVAKDLLVADEAEISEVMRRRLFETLGKESMRKAVARTYADWCFEHRSELPPEWTAVDSVATEAKARDYLRNRFEVCYPFHPATLTVFQRKWRSLTQFQQTRGTLAMLAQWISLAFAKGYVEARREPLITLGSAPLEAREFRSVVLGQLGEMRLDPALNSDIAGEQNKAAALDADMKGPLKGIYRRVGTAILFESSGGQSDQVAHLPELRFALGDPDVDTTSIDNAATALETRAFYIRKAGTDGYRFGLKPKLEKVVHDRRASLDDTEVRKAMEKTVDTQFRAGSVLHVQKPFPKDSADIEDIPQLNLVIVDPDEPWTETGELRSKLSEWTRMRGKSARLYPASLIWCVRKPGRELRDRIEEWLAWQRVHKEITDGTLGGEFEKAELRDVKSKVDGAEDEAREEVWASYRFIVFADPKSADGLSEIDFGAGTTSGAKSLTDRVLGALRSNTLLNESPGASYLQRHWPEAFKVSGAWPLKSLRQAFLDGSLDRVISPDEYLKRKIPEFVAKGDFGLASGDLPGGGFDEVRFRESISPDDVSFDAGVYLLRRERAEALRTGPAKPFTPEPESTEASTTGGETQTESTAIMGHVAVGTGEEAHVLMLTGAIPPELWNKVGIRIIPKLRSAQVEPQLVVNFTLEIKGEQAVHLLRDLKQAVADLGLLSQVKLELK
ncbi:MAG: ATP-binding protein [Deltaproteobacteria bacterium]|nr:ATP-binding protein [Deltaproteobacteria bacterium]